MEHSGRGCADHPIILLIIHDLANHPRIIQVSSNNRANHPVTVGSVEHSDVLLIQSPCSAIPPPCCSSEAGACQCIQQSRALSIPLLEPALIHGSAATPVFYVPAPIAYILSGLPGTKALNLMHRRTPFVLLGSRTH